MHKVRCDNQDVIQLLILRQSLVGRDHFIIRAVALDGIRPFGGFFQRDFGIGKKRARDDAAGAVEVNGFLVGIDDERALTAADESDIERSV